MDSDDPASFERQFLALLPWLERVLAFVARAHRFTPQDAEDFASRVKLKWIEGDYAVLRNFKGRSKLQTYLTAVIQHEAIEFERAQRGKWHPSAEAERGGRTLQLVEQYVVRDGYPWDEARETMRAKDGVSLTAEEFERLATRLPVRFPRRFQPAEILESVPAPQAAPDRGVRMHERDVLRERVRAVIRRFKAQVSEQDALILAYRFEDGRKIVDIARAIHVEQKALYRRIERLMLDLRAHFEREGLARDVVHELFDDME